MKFLTALFLVICLPFIAQAQSFPDAFIVSGVAANDVLNIRAEPSGSAAIVGELSPYMVNVEVLELSDDAKWGKVSTGEGNGWVSMRYMERSNHTPVGEVPRPMLCSGNEPFWSLGMHPRGDEFERPDDGRHDLTRINEVVAWQGYGIVFEEGPTLTRTLLIERGLCSDGMSDRDYGWRAVLLNEVPEGDNLLFGCCTLDNR